MQLQMDIFLYKILAFLCPAQLTSGCIKEQILNSKL